MTDLTLLTMGERLAFLEAHAQIVDTLLENAPKLANALASEIERAKSAERELTIALAAVATVVLGGDNTMAAKVESYLDLVCGAKRGSDRFEAFRDVIRSVGVKTEPARIIRHLRLVDSAEPSASGAAEL